MALVEVGLGILGGWLWGKLGEAAQSIDNSREVRKSLDLSLEKAFEEFSTSYPDFVASFFDRPFLEGNVREELAKLLTRDESPDIDAVVVAYQNQFSGAIRENVRPAIEDFFRFVSEAIKAHPSLQTFINNREIEETNQVAKATLTTVKETGEVTREIQELLSDGLDQQSGFRAQNTAVNSEILQGINRLLQQTSSVSSSLPTERPENGLNKLLTKQIDRARDLLPSGSVREAMSLLRSIEEEIGTADDYSRFRWHTCLAACYLLSGSYEEAAEGYLTAFAFAPEEEKALANKARAYLLLRDLDMAQRAANEGLEKYPLSSLIWAIKLNARLLAEDDDEDIEADLPEEIRSESDILFALSFIRARQGDFSEAFSLAKQSFEKKPEALEVKRALLESALSWVTQDPLPSFCGQIDPEGRKALEFAVEAFEPIESTLESLDQTPAYDELINNVAVALEVLECRERAYRIAQRGIDRGSSSEGLLRLRIEELLSQNDLSAVQRICERKLGAFSPGMLLTLAEIAAQKGEGDWASEIFAELEIRELLPDHISDLDALRVLTEWRVGTSERALKMGAECLQGNPDNAVLNILLARIMGQVGLDTQEQVTRCVELAAGSSCRNDKLQIADLLYDFEMFFEAAQFYKELVISPGANPITLRYLNSLLGSEQREPVRIVIESLPSEERQKSQIVIIEANLSRATGDWVQLHKLLGSELEKDPANSSIAISFAGSLFLLQEFEDLKRFMSTDPQFVEAPPEHEFEFAKYQAKYGEPLLAIRRMYKLLKKSPQDSTIAGYYLTILLLTDQVIDDLAVEQGGPGVATCIQNDESQKWIVIDETDAEKDIQWPELILPDSAMALQLTGKIVGETCYLDMGFSEVEVTVQQHEHLYLYAARKSREVVEQTANSSGPLWSVDVVKQDGELNLEPIHRSLKARKDFVNRMLSLYEQNNMPIAMLASAIGTDPVTLTLEWPNKTVGKFVGAGIHEGRVEERRFLQEEELPYVIDLPTLVELEAWGIVDEAFDLIGRPLIPNSMVEQLLHLIQAESFEVPRANGTMQDVDGEVRFIEVPEYYYQNRLDFLNRLLEIIRNKCEAVPAFGPAEPIKLLSRIGTVLDSASLDTIYIALEKNAALLSEDGAFRQLSKESGVNHCLGLQSVLMELRDRNRISQESYSKIVLEKLSFGHHFVSVTAEDLLWGARQSLYGTSALVKSVIETFKGQKLEIMSGINVCMSFLSQVAKILPPKVVKEYYKLCLDALCFEREGIANAIYESLRRNMEAAIPEVSAARRRTLRRALRALLVPRELPAPRVNLQRRKIALAVNRALWG